MRTHGNALASLCMHMSRTSKALKRNCLSTLRSREAPSPHYIPPRAAPGPNQPAGHHCYEDRSNCSGSKTPGEYGGTHHPGAGKATGTRRESRQQHGGNVFEHKSKEVRHSWESQRGANSQPLGTQRGGFAQRGGHHAGKGQSLANVTCYSCNQLGHYASH